jgi:hypothetical protein
MFDAKELTNVGLQQGPTPDLQLLLRSLDFNDFLATITSTSQADMMTQLNGMTLRAKFRSWRSKS